VRAFSSPSSCIARTRGGVPAGLLARERETRSLKYASPGPSESSESSCAMRRAATTTGEGKVLGRQAARQIIRHSSAGAYLSVLRCIERTVTPTVIEIDGSTDCSEHPRVRARTVVARWDRRRELNVSY
jgi:hypothetical protein